MPMKKEQHEALLNELLNREIEHSRLTEILQDLRVDYGTVQAEHEEITNKNTKLQKDNDDLIISNSKLFRQLGVTTSNPETQKEEEQKTFSQSVTIESLEKE